MDSGCLALKIEQNMQNYTRDGVAGQKINNGRCTAFKNE